jgi:uncharacterized cupin superfamily protein
LLVGDGMPVFHHGWEALVDMLDARDGVLTRRVNLDELAFVPDGGPPPYTGAAAEVGRLLGATRLGYALGVLERGEVYCPNHWHTQEEEAFVVWSGTPTLRTPQGTFELRPGDVIAFATGERGAHRLSNEGDTSAVILMFANIDPGDVCHYPDSRKLLVETTGVIVRSEPALDYFEGER